MKTGKAVQHNRADKLEEVVQGDVFTLKDALLAFRRQFGTKGTTRKLVAACLCVGISMFFFLSRLILWLTLYIDVFRPLHEKKKSVVPYLTFVEVASHWKFRLVGFPANTSPVFGPEFNSQMVNLSMWKAFEREIENGNLRIVQWTAGYFILFYFIFVKLTFFFRGAILCLRHS